MATSDSTPTHTSYQEFLSSKLQNVQLSGFDVSADDINPKLFKFQNACVRWALRLGKAALFEECGLGQTFQQIEWARLVAKHTGGKVLILAPLAVAGQTVLEAEKLNVTIKYVQDQSEVDTTINITNYDRLHLFDPLSFVGIVLDESSILKSMMGKTKQALIDAFQFTPYKLCCTATPAPNDHIELGNHSEFLNVKKSGEMLATWFLNDASDTGTWRLKRHAEKDFWRWLTSWAVCLSAPKDLGEEYDLPAFTLPQLINHEYRLAAAQASIDRAHNEGRLIPDDSPSSTGMHKVKRESLANRIEQVKDIVSNIPESEQVLIWCDTDYEADALIEAFPEATEVRGNTKDKEPKLLGFASNEYRILITKPSIAGYGLNYQNCANQVLVGVSYSFEKFYQAIRRSWRFGQSRDVHIHIVYSETEGNIIIVLKNKQEEFKKMQKSMTTSVKENGLFRDTERGEVTSGKIELAKGNNWQLYMGDCVEQVHNIADNSVGLSVYSPPFPDIFMYNDSVKDMGNSLDLNEFQRHYSYLIPEIYRITIPGRITVVHCVDLPSFKYKHGHTGLRDFPGEIIKAHVDAGWIYHSRVTIWKNPVVEMQRTKSHALLHKNFTARAEQVRQGIPDYLVIFRKPDTENTDNVKQNRHVGDYIGTEPPTAGEYTGWGKSEDASYSIAVWQRYASPVWFDIDQTNVLNFKLGKSNEDEKHICPLQLDVIERCIDLWSNKGDTVFSPFAGVGSELYTAVKMGRKAVGIELKESYWKQAQKFLHEADLLVDRPSLFDLLTSE